jgi:hypothetical protein
MENIEVPKKIGHIIPQKAREKFVDSKESIFENDNTVKRYMNSLSPKSRRVALTSLIRGCWILHKTPKEIMELEPKKLRMLLNDFETFVLDGYKNPTLYLEKYLTKNQCLGIGKALKGFIKTNAVKLGDLEYKAIFKNLFDLPIDSDIFTPNKNDIRTVYSHATETFKLLIHFETNCPLRREEVQESLTWNKLGDLSLPYQKIDFVDTELKGHGIGKYKGCHFTMIICESLRKALLEYKEKEKKRFRDNLIPISEEEFNNLPIFLSSDISETEGEKTIEPLSYSAYGNAFYSLQKRTKIPLSFHSFRYYVQEVIEKMLGTDSPWNYFFLGHKLPLIQATYSHLYKNYDEVLKAFKKVEPYLDLFYDETKVNDQLKIRFTQLKAEGKTDSEALDGVLRERSQMLVQEMNTFRETMLSQIKQSEEKYKKEA